MLETFPTGAATTSCFICTFSPWLTEANVSEITGIGDETGMVDGPDGRGYANGVPVRQNLTIKVPSNTDAARALHRWMTAVENGLPDNEVTGIVQFLDLARQPVAAYELRDAKCHGFKSEDANKRQGEVHQETFMVSYSRALRQ